MFSKEELIEILKIENSTTFHNSNNKMIGYIIERLTASGINFIEQKTKISHNIYLIKPGRPLVCCHTDSMKLTKDDAKRYKGVEIYISEENGVIKASRSGKKAILGGDDGCGIFILLNLLEEGADISFAFFSNEEVGMLGSRTFPQELLDGIPYGLVIDRMGNSDIICTKNGYGSQEFEIALSEVGEEFGYKPAQGFCSDADVLRNHMSCANISCGYFDAHTTDESVVYEDVVKANLFIKKFLETHSETFFPISPKAASLYVDKTVSKATKELFEDLRNNLINLASEEQIISIILDNLYNRR